jgi:hypothetical protein
MSWVGARRLQLLPGGAEQDLDNVVVEGEESEPPEYRLLRR